MITPIGGVVGVRRSFVGAKLKGDTGSSGGGVKEGTLGTRDLWRCDAAPLPSERP